MNIYIYTNSYKKKKITNLIVKINMNKGFITNINPQIKEIICKLEKTILRNLKTLLQNDWK